MKINSLIFSLEDTIFILKGVNKVPSSFGLKPSFPLRIQKSRWHAGNCRDFCLLRQNLFDHCINWSISQKVQSLAYHHQYLLLPPSFQSESLFIWPHVITQCVCVLIGQWTGLTTAGPSESRGWRKVRLCCSGESSSIQTRMWTRGTLSS